MSSDGSPFDTRQSLRPSSRRIHNIAFEYWNRSVPTVSRYAVFGQPIGHSLSPRIHAMFGAELGIALDYRAIETGRDDFAHALEAFARDGGNGANVTLPLKEDALSLCVDLSQRARRCGSVNTVIRRGENWRGDSTDGIGLLRDLRERFAFDLVVHATAAGHVDATLDLPRNLVSGETLAYDLSYGRAATAFIAWAQASGTARAADGLGMLIEQAAESFAIWHGLMPDTMPVYDEMRALLAASGIS